MRCSWAVDPRLLRKSAVPWPIQAGDIVDMHAVSVSIRESQPMGHPDCLDEVTAFDNSPRRSGQGFIAACPHAGGGN